MQIMNQNSPQLYIDSNYARDTYFGSVEDNIFAIWKNAYGPRWELILSVIESHPCSCLWIII